MSIKEFAEDYKAATDAFLTVLAGLDASDLDKRDSEGWSPRQVIHHVADSEAQSYARLRRLIAEPGTAIQGYEEGKWAENSTLNYNGEAIEASVAVFKAVRESSYQLLTRLHESELENKGVHTESGEYSVRTWLQTYTNHPLDHAAQIRNQLG